MQKYKNLINKIFCITKYEIESKIKYENNYLSTMDANLYEYFLLLHSIEYC